MHAWGTLWPIFTILAACISHSGKVTGRCDDGWILWAEGGKCYHVSSKENQEDAESAFHYCKNQLDSSLVSLENYAEWKFVNYNVTHCLSHKTCTEADDRYWIGIYKEEMTQSEIAWERMDGYIWVDKSPYSREKDFYLWGTSNNEPIPNTQCATLNVNGYLSGQHCIFSYRYICEKDALPETTTIPTTVVPTTSSFPTTEAPSTPPLKLPPPSPSSLPSIGNTANIIKAAYICVLLSLVILLERQYFA